ncbi:uncharacterized protein [Watersipora subatra]|uniref:uncharacterized protein n=1 Tax=Watersipora subatra TaxID=2589382 RepID=UPI00355C96F3
MSDNGPQFVAQIFKRFVTKWDINHITSAPKWAQSNGKAERAVQTVESLLNKNVNLQAALCAYRDTPLANRYSPAQLLFNRSTNSMGIMSGKQVDVDRLRTVERDQRENQGANYNRRHAARDRSPIAIGRKFVAQEPKRAPAPATVIAAQGREVVVVNKQQNLIRRNRSQVARAQAPGIVKTSPEKSEESSENTVPEVAQPTRIPEENLVQRNYSTSPNNVEEQPERTYFEVVQSPAIKTNAV